MEGLGTRFSLLPFVGLVYIYIICADEQHFIHFEHKVLKGFVAEGLGLHFPSAYFMCLLMRAIVPS